MNFPLKLAIKELNGDIHIAVIKRTFITPNLFQRYMVHNNKNKKTVIKIIMTITIQEFDN